MTGPSGAKCTIPPPAGCRIVDCRIDLGQVGRDPVALRDEPRTVIHGA